MITYYIFNYIFRRYCGLLNIFSRRTNYFVHAYGCGCTKAEFPLNFSLAAKNSTLLANKLLHKHEKSIPTASEKLMYTS